MYLLRTVLALLVLSLSSLSANAIVNGIGFGNFASSYDAVGAFAFTSSIDGSSLPHNNTFGNAILIAPDKVILSRHLIDSTYSPSNQPPEGFYTVRFRRRIDGGIGTNPTDWQSFYQVKIKSFIFRGREQPTSVEGTIIGVLDVNVNHINPMPVDPDFIPTAGTAVAIAAWGIQEFVLDANGSIVSPPGFGPTPPEFFAKPRGTLRMMLAIADTSCSGISFPSLSEAGSNSPSGASAYLFDSGGAVLAINPASGALTLVGVVQSVGGSTRVQEHTYFNSSYCCDGWKKSLVSIRKNKCADINADDIVDGNDLGLVLGALGTQCSSINNCPFDLNWDGLVDTFDQQIVQAQWGFIGPCSDLQPPLRRCSADFNADGIVDGADLGVLNGAFGDCGCTGCDHDLNRDGIVDGGDLGILLGQWGGC